VTQPYELTDDEYAWADSAAPATPGEGRPLTLNELVEYRRVANIRRACNSDEDRAVRKLLATIDTLTRERDLLERATRILSERVGDELARAETAEAERYRAAATAVRAMQDRDTAIFDYTQADSYSAAMKARALAAEQRATRAEGVVEAARTLGRKLALGVGHDHPGRLCRLCDAERALDEALATYDQEDRK
jgi:hypothetical protein